MSAEANISPSGEFTYSIPITMSESTGGFKPEFSFEYTSGGRNGPLGVGWSISGLDSVVRCEKNMEVDGESAKVNFTSSDRFCMNGQRLLVKSGHSYGGNNSEYRLQQDDGQKVVAHTSSSSKGPNGFTVFDTEGNKYFFGKYGSAVDAIIKTTDGKHFSWALKRVEDASGNYYQYKYEQQSGSLEYRVKEINYSGNGSSGTHNKLVFDWETRNDTSKVSYIHGQKNSLTKRLKSLKTYYSSHLVREYKLKYQYESNYLANSSASKLVSIQACNGDSNCLSPTIFNWTQRTLGPNQLRFIDSRDYSHNSRYKSHKMLDFNGDGLMDIAYVRNDRGSSSDHLYMIPNTGGGLGKEKRIYDIASKTFRRSWKIVDYDRDGKDDILYARYSSTYGYRWYVYRHIIGDEFESVRLTGATPSSTESSSRFADITGDGYQDLLHISDNKMVVQKGLRSLGVSATEQEIIYQLNKGSATRVTVEDYDKEDNSFPTADFNGDGRADFLVQVKATTYRPPIDECERRAGRPPEPCDLRKLQNTKPNMLVQQVEQFSAQAVLPTSVSRVETIDVSFKPSTSGVTPANAPEVSAAKHESPANRVQSTSSNTTWRVLVSDGDRTLTEFANLGGIYHQEHTLLADVNGDGLTDFIYKNENNDNWYARINNGNGFNSAVFAAPDNNKDFIKVVDINGDGAQELYAEIDGKDYFYFYNGNGFTSKYYNSINSDYDYVDWIDLNGDGAPDRLKFSGRSSMWISRDSGEPRITSVTNGFGAKTSVTYTTLTNTNVYTPDNDANIYTWGNFGRVKDLKGAVRVASSLWKDQELLKYQYFGGKMQVGRGLLGYRQVAIESSKAKTRIVTTYRQDSIYRGSVIGTETYIRPASYGETPPGDDDGDPEPPDLCENQPELCDCTYRRPNELKSFGYNCDVLPYNADKSYSLASKSKFSSSLVFQNSAVTSSSNANWVLKSTTSTEYDLKEQNSYRIVKDGAVLTQATRVYPYETITTTYNTDSNIGEVLATQTKEISIDNFGNILSKTVEIESPWGNSSEVTVAEYSGPHYGGRKDFEAVTKTYTNKRDGHFVSSDTKSFRTDYGYDSKGRLTSKTDDNGVLTEYERHPINGLVQIERTSKAGTQLPIRTTEYGFDSTYRHVTSQTNSLGHSSITTYDNLGRKDYVESANRQRTYSEYNHMGRLIAEIQTPANSTSKTSSAAITKSMSQYWCQSVNHCPTAAVYYEETIAEGKPDARVYYDAYGRERRKSSAGLDSNSWINVDIFYDGLGRKTGETVPHFSGTNNPEQSVVEYDGQNRVTKIIKPDDSEWSTEYAGLAVTSVNPNDARNTQIKNAMGLLVQVIDANDKIANYEYDANGKAAKLAGPNGHPITVQYDKYGNKRFLIDPDKGTIEYRYDDYFQLVWQRDARGIIVENDYDAIGRVAKTKRSISANKVEQEIEYIYDTGSYALGQLYEVKDVKSGYVNRFFYDAFSRKREQHTIIDGDTYSETWQFNNAGQLELETDATGQSVRYTYNTNKHLTALYDNQSHSTIWQAHAIDALGNVTNETLGSGISRIKEFDVRTGMLTHLYSVGEEQLQSLDYHWDDIGNLQWRRDNAINKTENFEYDNLNRVRFSRIEGGDTTEIRYDDSGNITYKTGVGTYHYESGKPHAVTRVTGEMANNYQYDASGNMVQDNKRVLVYNSYDKPIYVGKDGYWMKFAYNHSGQRYKRTEFGGSKGTLIPIFMGDITSWVPMAQETRYVGNVEFVRYGGTSEWLQKRYIAGKVIITSVRNQSTSPTVRYLLDDHLGSTHVIVSANGRIEEKMSFDVFGARRNATTWKREHKKISQYTSAITLRGYTGHEQMDEVGLVHMGGRIYDPVLGRFLQADPMIQAPENIQSLNRYSYVMNNPLNKTDPSGYIWVTLATMALKYIAANTTSLILAKAISFALTAYEFYSEVTFYVSVIKALGGNSAEMAQFAGGLAKSYAKSAAIAGALQITGLDSINKAYEDRMKSIGNAETDMGEAKEPLKGELGDPVGNEADGMKFKPGSYGLSANQSTTNLQTTDIDETGCDTCYPFGKEAQLAEQTNVPEFISNIINGFSRIQFNRAFGLYSEEFAADIKREEGFTVFEGGVTLKVDGKIRYPDLTLLKGGVLYGFAEVKSGVAPLVKRQILLDKIIQTRGAVITRTPVASMLPLGRIGPTNVDLYRILKVSK